ncbi:unnamed protein product [Arabidopsis halleri]
MSHGLSIVVGDSSFLPFRRRFLLSCTLPWIFPCVDRILCDFWSLISLIFA